MKKHIMQRVVFAMASLSIMLSGNFVSVSADEMNSDEFISEEVFQKETEEEGGFFSGEEVEIWESEETSAVCSAEGVPIEECKERVCSGWNFDRETGAWYRLDIPMSGIFRIGSATVEIFTLGSNGEYEKIPMLYEKPQMWAEYRLELGNEYYLHVTGSFYEETENGQRIEKNTGDLVISEKYEVISISVNMKDTKISEKIESSYLKNTEFIFRFYFGDVPPVACNENSGTFIDMYEDSYTYCWQNVSDPTGKRYKAGSSLEPGTYRLIVTGKTGDIPLDKDYTIEVTALDTPAMNVGLNKKVQTPKEKFAWYSFIPSQTGDYAWFRISNIKVLKADPDGPKEVECRPGGHKSMYRLEKDCIYYVGFKGAIYTGTDASDEVKHYEFDINLYKCDNVINATILEKNLIKKVYVEGAAYIQQETGDILVTYADGHKEIVKYKEIEGREDSSGNEFSLYFKDSAGKIYIHHSYLKKGEYTAVVSCNGYVVDTINAPTFQILPVKEVSQGKLKEGVNKNIESKGNWYTFSPKKSGKYGFYLDQEPDLYTLKENGKLHWVSKRISYSDDRRITKYPLKKGVTYYVEFHNGGFFQGVDAKGDAIFADKGNVTIKIKDDCKKSHTFNPCYDKIIKKATCNKEGSKKSFCVDCGKTFTTSIPATKKHKPGAWEVSKAATVTSTGKKVRKCVTCGKELDTKKIPKLSSRKIKTKKITGLKDKVTVKKNSKLTLKPVLIPEESQQKITYSSSDEKIATVNKKGVITGKKKGTVEITVTSGKAIKKVKVKVK